MTGATCNSELPILRLCMISPGNAIWKEKEYADFSTSVVGANSRPTGRLNRLSTVRHRNSW
jgi:hypothetical protein